MLEITQVQDNFFLVNIILVIIAIFFLIFSTLIKALIVGLLKIMFDIVLAFILIEDVKLLIFKINIWEKIKLFFKIRK